MKMCVILFAFITISLATVDSLNISKTEVFVIHIKPSLFNWTYEGDPEQFVYHASLLNYPDLPSWINYHYSDDHKTGFLYGVPPENQQSDITLEIVALNRKNYDTHIHILPIHIKEKASIAKNEVHLKIDNLNVEDMFDYERVERLKNVFRKNLWKDSSKDLYLTFLASAVQLGARLPLNPKEGEGVVLRIGSKAHLSTELIKLQNEVKPLWKHTSCPRDFKRTTVERTFRDAGFALDWCVFRLIEQQSSANVKKLKTVSNLNSEMVWESVAKEDVPQRSYKQDFAFSILVPIFIMTILALMLSFILCFHHEGIHDELSEEFFNNLYHICTDYIRSKNMEGTPKHEASHYATIHRATQSLRSLSNSREISCLSPDLTIRSHTESPTSTMVRGIHCRPSPPPYIRPKFKPEL